VLPSPAHFAEAVPPNARLYVSVNSVVGDVVMVGDAEGVDVGDAVGVDVVGNTDVTGDSVGGAVGDAVGGAVGVDVVGATPVMGGAVGDAVGVAVGDAVGGVAVCNTVGEFEGTSDGDAVGVAVGDAVVEVAVCNTVGEFEGTSDGAFVSGGPALLTFPYTSTSESAQFQSKPKSCTKDPSMSSKVRVTFRTSVEGPIVSSATTSESSFRI